MTLCHCRRCESDFCEIMHELFDPCLPCNASGHFTSGSCISSFLTSSALPRSAPCNRHPVTQVFDSRQARLCGPIWQERSSVKVERSFHTLLVYSFGMTERATYGSSARNGKSMSKRGRKRCGTRNAAIYRKKWLLSSIVELRKSGRPQKFHRFGFIM